MKGNKKIRILLGLVVALGMVLCMTAGLGKKTKAATTVTVTFDSNGGSEVEAQVIEKGGQAVEPEDPTNGDLYFAGWFLNPTADNIVDPETYDIKTFDFDTPVTEDITLTALWVARANINVIGYGMGKINYAAEGEELDDMYGTSIVISSIIGISDTFTIDAKAEEGSTFVKWQKVIVQGETEEDSEYEDFSTEPTLQLTITEPIDLVAVFESEDIEPIDVKKYTVTFDSNGGSEVEAQTVEDGAQAVKPEDPTNGNLYFVGWFVNPTIDNIFDMETYEVNSFDFNTPITEDITLTALWSAETHINTIGTGRGHIAYAEDDEELDEYVNSIVISAILGINDTFTIDAKAEEGSKFVKWQKVIVEGETEADSQYEDYSTEPTLKLTITESFDLVAVFEPIEDEKKDDKEEEKEEKEEADDATADDAKVDAPKADDNLDKTVQTGDHSEPFAAVIVMMASAAATVFFVYKRRQKRDSQ
ncbi:repeat domain (List_Bact_rpt) [Eubacterium ruminantium]|nr:repeat domain (List_Bact_rpt) [Eubacterium ruminantium]